MALSSNVSTAIQQIFVGLLGRPVAQQGLDYWTEQVNNGFGLEEVMANIVNEQPEYLDAFGDLDRAEAVTLHFQQLFGRAPTIDAAGNNYWINGAGADVPVNELVLALIAGAQGNDIQALNNRVIVADAYTRAATETGNFNIATAKAILVDVDHTNTSVAEALNEIDGATFNIPNAVEAIFAAQDAKAEFLAGLDLDNNPATPTAEGDVTDLIDSTVATGPVGIFLAETGITLAGTATASQRQAAYNAARADLEGDIADQEATIAGIQATIAGWNANAEVAAYIAALEAQESAVAAQGVTNAAFQGEVTEYNLLNAVGVDPAELTVTIAATPVVTLGASWQAIATLDGNTLVVTPGAANNPGVADLLAAANADVAAQITQQQAAAAAVAAEAALNDADAGGAGASDIVDDLLEAEDDLADLIDDQADLEDLIVDVEGAYALNAELAALNQAITAAEDALVDYSVVNIEPADPAATANGTANDDVFIYFADNGEATVNGFGTAGDDVIYFGAEYSLVPIGQGQTIANNLGSTTALEIFWVQNGANLELYVENVATAGNGTTDADMGVITLTGVSMADLDFANGMLVA